MAVSHSPKYRLVARTLSAVFLSLTSLGLLAGTTGCASRLLAVGDWAQAPNLQLDNESLQGSRMRVGCYRLNRDGKLQAQSYRVCSGLATDLEAHGAVIDESDDDREPAQPVDYTIQYVDLRKVETSASYWSLAGSALTGWIVPFVSSTQSSAEFRILDGRGVTIDHVPMTIAQVTVFGWSAIGGYFGDSDPKQKQMISRQVYLAARNRLASRVRSKRWAQP